MQHELPGYEYLRAISLGNAMPHAKDCLNVVPQRLSTFASSKWYRDAQLVSRTQALDILREPLFYRLQLVHHLL